MTESQNIEWKESWRDEQLKGICAFANTKGGVLVVGKNDKGKVIGVKNAKKLMEDLPSKISNMLGIFCEVNLLTEGDLEYIEVIVEPSKQAVSYQGRHYKRSGSTTRMLTDTALTEFIMDKSNIQWDNLIEPEVTIGDINEETIEKFKQKAVSSERMPFIKDENDIETILKKLELVNSKGEYTKASVLLFGNNTQRYVTTAYAKIGRFGDSDADLRSQEVVEGNAFELTEKIIFILDTKYIIRNISYDGTHRVETPEYPFEALREIIYNAIIHRKYDHTPIFISMYDDRMMIWNHGELPDGLTIEKLKEKHLSQPRNKLLASVFYKAGYIETWGRGTLKIIEECKKHGLPEPKIEMFSGGFGITIFKEIYSEDYLEKLDLNDRQKKAIIYIKENESITNSIYREMFDIAHQTAIRDFDELIKLKMISKTGEGRGTKYVINVDGYKTL